MWRWTLVLSLVLCLCASVVSHGESATAYFDYWVRVDMSPEDGFHWAYYLFIPKAAHEKERVHLFVEPNNTGRPDDDPAVHDRAAFGLLWHGYPNALARQLGTPLLVPTFPRPATQPPTYTHALTRDAMLISRGSLARLDIQLVRMINHARSVLAKRGIVVGERVFMHGFSASGDFVTRFALMHPEVIRAYAAGGFGDGFVTLPLSMYRGEVLRYPVGVADLESLTGATFNKDAFSSVPAYLYRGELDTNTCLAFPGCYSPSSADQIRWLFGRDVATRWRCIADLFDKEDVPASFVTYPNVGHALNLQIGRDLVEFFRSHMGD